MKFKPDHTRDFDALTVKHICEIMETGEECELPVAFEIPEQVTSSARVTSELSKLPQGKAAAVMAVLVFSHAMLEQGLACDEDHVENEFAAKNGYRVVSVFPWITTSKAKNEILGDDSIEFDESEDRVWVITSADRTDTCVMFPSEY